MLACAGGMSTSLLVTKMKAAAKANDADYQIFATAAAEIRDRLTGDQRPDVLLLGPQIRYIADKTQALADQVGVPMAVINMHDYGTMNGVNVLKTAEQLIKP
ncbi:PTS sugar transporter subunit IIB [Lactiplantibacillus sp. WILCCON 0030]|uniref:PTS sugar transporter subunit IIB n=2 Tax=Lactiplantibacillus brownii TaxID=3069269 RepID=A0ABU1A583_9LACO|nr:PTS sugar transporter subunit IIB [Lactiplantibacillus brownii]MDQ7936148.1 PTS sugar transporter subunit IIB [Lactiplantibacillus brownii]